MHNDDEQPRSLLLQVKITANACTAQFEDGHELAREWVPSAEQTPSNLKYIAFCMEINVAALTATLIHAETHGSSKQPTVKPNQIQNLEGQSPFLAAGTLGLAMMLENNASKGGNSPANPLKFKLQSRERARWRTHPHYRWRV